MQLQFKSPYLSISQFNPIELAEFSVLTGVNGSGKSHLLEAIERRNVVIAGMENSKIVRFNYESFKLENEAAFNAHQIYSERESAWQFFNQQIKGSVLGWKNNIGGEYASFADSCKQSKKNFLEIANDKIQSYKTNVKNYFTGNQYRGNAQAQSIYSLAKRLPISIDEIPHDDFVRMYKPYEYKNDFLPQQLGKIIWDYYVKFRNNQVNEFENEKNGKQYPFVCEEDFVSAHGAKPWELMNEILRTFDSLEYKVNSPEGSDLFASFQLKLVHTKNPALEIDFSALSSGEKVLMALVASVYKASMDNVFPDVLLLDEVDASLHPSMMKNMLEVIRNVFLARSVRVILVTHSPTTIALAPEESVYVMNRVGLNRIEKKSKQAALSILTEGFATLDEGVRLFDQVSKNKISIITEGNNTNLIKKACELYDCRDIEVISGFESVSGKGQLKVLFDFFTRATHTSKVIFVWDCDAKYSLTETNNTYPHILFANPNNSIALSGIENMFAEDLFCDFKKIITRSIGTSSVEFDETRKKDFERYVIERSSKDDFVNFKPLIDFVNTIKAL